MSVAALVEIAERYGTPCFAYDLRRLTGQVELLGKYLPQEVKIFYSLKANASLGISQVLAARGLGADVASAGELATAVAAGFSPHKIFVAGPYKSPDTLAWLEEHPEAYLSIDSPSELERLTDLGLTNRALMRLRPDFRSGAVVTAGADSRFGFRLDELAACRRLVATSDLNLIGFHIFAGSQVLNSDAVILHLKSAFDLAHRASEILKINLQFMNLGGGFGIPYRAGEGELDLAPIGDQLQILLDQCAPATLALELGRFLVAQAGWYITRVVGRQQHISERAAWLSMAARISADLCGLCLRTKAAPPLAISMRTAQPIGQETVAATDVMGCLSLPADVLAEGCLLPPLSPGDVLAFANSGAYGIWASAAHFHAYPLPAEIAFQDKQLCVLREPRPASEILNGQIPVSQNLVTQLNSDHEHSPSALRVIS